MRALLFLVGLACLAGCKDRREPARAPEEAAKPPAATRDREGIDLRIDSGLPAGMRHDLQKALDSGVPFQRVELVEAVRKGQVAAGASGVDLRSATVRLELKSKHVLAVDVAPGTFLGAKNGRVQNMVVLAPQTTWLWPDQPNQKLGVAVACANMLLEEPKEADELVVQPLPSRGSVRWADLRKLLSAADFAKADRVLQQFAVWTITENPAPDAYKPLSVTTTLSNGVRLPPSRQGPQLDLIEALFKKAGIDPTRYAALQKPPGEPPRTPERVLQVRLRQVDESRIETEAAIYKQAIAAKSTPEQAKAKMESAEAPRRLKEVAEALRRAGAALAKRKDAERKAYEDAKAKGVWEDKALQTAEEAVRTLAKDEAEARAEADAIYQRWSKFLVAPLRW